MASRKLRSFPTLARFAVLCTALAFSHAPVSAEPTPAELDAFLKVVAQNGESLAKIKDYSFDFHLTRVSEDARDNSRVTATNDGHMIACKDGVAILTYEISSDKFPNSPRMATLESRAKTDPVAKKTTHEGDGFYRQGAQIHDREKSIRHLGNMTLVEEGYPEFKDAENIGWATQCMPESPDRSAYAYYPMEAEGPVKSFSETFSEEFLRRFEYRITHDNGRIRFTFTKRKWTDEPIDIWYEFDPQRGGLMVDSGANIESGPNWRHSFELQRTEDGVWFPRQMTSVSYINYPAGTLTTTVTTDISNLRVNKGVPPDAFYPGILAKLPFKPTQFRRMANEGDILRFQKITADGLVTELDPVPVIKPPPKSERRLMEDPWWQERGVRVFLGAMILVLGAVLIFRKRGQ